MFLPDRSPLEDEPQPWSRETIEKAYFNSFARTREVVEETEGGRLWRSLSDLQDTLWIFQQSVTELLDEISIFSDRSTGSAFWDEVNSDLAESHKRAVKRCIFSCTSSLMALVDHARKFNKTYPVEGFAAKILERFPSTGPHAFLHRLRNYNLHWRVAEANWNISVDFVRGVREARFVMPKRELLSWDGWNADSRCYIESSPDPIDVRKVFFDYREAVHKFYSWHWGEVLSQHSETCRPYFEYKRIITGIRKRILWNSLLTNPSENFCTYSHLARHLPKQQVERLLALDGQSEAQVDALIEILELQEFFDASLRVKALAFFQKNA